MASVNEGTRPGPLTIRIIKLRDLATGELTELGLDMVHARVFVSALMYRMEREIQADDRWKDEERLRTTQANRKRVRARP